MHRLLGNCRGLRVRESLHNAAGFGSAKHVCEKGPCEVLYPRGCIAMSGQASAPSEKKIVDMPSRAWSLETLKAGLDAVAYQQIKDETIDADLQDFLM